MKKSITTAIFSLTILVFLSCLWAEPPKSTPKPTIPKVVPSGAKIFITEMDHDLDGYIRARMIKKKIPLTIVSTEEEAEFVMIGSSTKREKQKWHEGWLTEEKPKTYGNATIIHRETGTIVWAASSGDYNFWGKKHGHARVAGRIVKQLKKVIR